VQALYHKSVALAKLDTTAFSDAVTLGNDLLVELSISREGDIFLLHSRVYDDFFRFSEVKDNRVLYVKLADRLHNMRTIEGHTPLAKQKEIASETLRFFVPIARYLKLHPIEKELQQLASQVIRQP
jgi:hypothetical protein